LYIFVQAGIYIVKLAFILRKRKNKKRTCTNWNYRRWNRIYYKGVWRWWSRMFNFFQQVFS